MEPIVLARDSRVPFIIYRLPVVDILRLRHKVLRPGLPLSSASFTGDELPSTWHVGLARTEQEGEIICCASFIPTSSGIIEAWQLRGMATDPAHQGHGYGRILLRHAENCVATESLLNRFWCNARVEAIPFYEKMGWRVTSQEFTVPGVGPHKEMVKIL